MGTHIAQENSEHVQIVKRLYLSSSSAYSRQCLGELLSQPDDNSRAAVVPTLYYGILHDLPNARCFCGGNCRHNSSEYDYCGGKPGLSLLPLILTLTLTLNPNPKDDIKPKPNPTDPTHPNRLTTNPSLPPQ